MFHTCHILPPSEIDLGLSLAVFAGSGGKYLFHRIGWKGRIWQLCLLQISRWSRPPFCRYHLLVLCVEVLSASLGWFEVFWAMSLARHWRSSCSFALVSRGCGYGASPLLYLGEHKPGRIKPGRIKRAALSLQNQNYHIVCFLVRPRLYASDLLESLWLASSRSRLGLHNML